MPLIPNIVTQAYKITIAKVKRGLVPLDKQPVLPADVNPAITWINDRSDITTVANSLVGGTSQAIYPASAISGTVTTGTLTTGGNSVLSYTVTNPACAVNSTVLVYIAGGNNTTGVPVILRVTASAGSFLITVRNIDAAAFNGNLIFKFIIL